MALCSQCGRPALYKVNGHPLCVDCNYKVQMGQWMAFAENASYMNSLMDQMDAVTGVYGTVGRIQIPPPPTVVQGGQTVLNNIRIENSTVGVVNTGYARSIDSVVTSVRKQGNEKLAARLCDFAQAVIDSQDLPEESKSEVLSQLAFLSQQIVAERKEAPSVMRSILSGIERAINISASLATLWPLLYPLLKAALNA